MTGHDVAVVGTGGIASNHAEAWQAQSNCRLVGCADIVRDRAENYAREYGIPSDSVYEDYELLLRETDPDVVSVCTPESTHEEIIVGIARTGIPDAIHCEKAMADTWGGARRIAEEARGRDVQLTFNHQRRFGTPWRDAKELIDAGEIGDLQRMEYSFADLLTYGVHQIDTFGSWNDDRPAEWVIGQIDYREENVHRGTHVENQAFATWKYDNGVYGLASTQHGSGLVGSYSRVRGTNGEIEIRKHFADDMPAYSLAVRRAGETEWEVTEYSETEIWQSTWERAFVSVVDALESGNEPALGVDNALNVTEVVFAVYESSRRRGRVDLPLEIDDNPLEDLAERGELTPEPLEDDG